MMDKEVGQPWWKFGHAWMVFGLPAIVVLASFITLYLAIKHPDPVLSGYNQVSQSQVGKINANMAPAMQARNHAATGITAPVQP